MVPSRLFLSLLRGAPQYPLLRGPPLYRLHTSFSRFLSSSSSSGSAKPLPGAPGGPPSGAPGGPPSGAPQGLSRGPPDSPGGPSAGAPGGPPSGPPRDPAGAPLEAAGAPKTGWGAPGGGPPGLGVGGPPSEWDYGSLEEGDYGGPRAIEYGGPPMSRVLSPWVEFVRGLNPLYEPRQYMFKELSKKGIDVEKMGKGEITTMTKLLLLQRLHGAPFPLLPYGLTLQHKIRELQEKYPLKGQKGK
ncbi:hypothetical protein, conserved [Eimeria brunetti]|uniref:Uncharacterized protein n=1 Tax=Eimeria brunetti TaxID=51314 RepID=U6LB29_9EIME|nr:hypothetical protein, conserved [Eimeria brunetti]